MKEFNVVFSGKTKNANDRHIIASKIARALKKDETYVDLLLSGKPIVIKCTKDINQANQVLQKLDNLGAIAEIIVVDREDAPIPRHLNRSTTQNSSAAKQLNFDKADNGSAKCVSLGKRLQYRFDTFMAKGSGSSFKALLIVFVAIFLLVAGLRGVIYWLGPGLPQQYEALDVIGNVYITFLQLTDPGNMAQDILSSAWYKVFAVIAGLTGVILLSALIAVITTGLDQKMAELKRGRSKVIEKGHTLIIGWDEQRIIEILRELVFANESEQDACVVILADKDKQEIDDALRLRMTNTKTTRVVTRSGKGTIPINLDMVSVESAKSVIILAGCADYDTETAKAASDALVIQTILAVTTRSIDKEDYAIVAEVYNDTYRDTIEQTFPNYVVTLDTGNILAKILVQTSRSVGLSVVYSEILSFDGCEMYFYKASWGRARFGELAYHFHDGVPIGVRHTDGKLHLNPPKEYELLDDDAILIVADDDSTIEYMPEAVIVPPTYPTLVSKAQQRAEKELIIGWNNKAETILEEFSDYVTEGSEIDVVVVNPTEGERLEIERINRGISNIKINLMDINPLDRAALAAIKPEEYDNIIILASARGDKDTQQIDSENIITLLLLRSIFQERRAAAGKTKLITEVLDSQNYELIAVAGVKDMVISNRLISMITAQISESRGIKNAYDDIFQEAGSEIYLKPLTLYFNKFPVETNFAGLISAAQNRGEVCFGVKIKALEDDQRQNNGIELIPNKEKTFILGRDDCLVVVAENEL